MVEKTPPKGELEGSPRKAKSPRLDRGRRSLRRRGSWKGVPALALEASNLMEEGTEVSSGNNPCNHVLTDIARTRLSSSLLSKGAARTCVGCQLEDAKGSRHRKHRPAESSILVCLECGCFLCCGVGGIEYPFGHSRAHAMNEQHWVAVLHDDVERGYCFNCNAEVRLPAEFEVDDYVIGIDVIRDAVRSLCGAMRLSPEEVTRDNNLNQAEGRASGFGVVTDPSIGLPTLGDKYHSHEFGPANGQGYAIKGIPNIANTCYMNAILQCLLALDKLRERMLSDAPNSLFGMVFKELFVETGVSGGILKPEKIFQLICWRSQKFKPGKMEDSHELLHSLRDILNEDELRDDRESGAPTVIDSIFGFEVSDSLSCKKCGFSRLVPHPLFYDLPLPLPSKWRPTKSAASAQTSESLKSRQKIVVQLFPANEESNLEKIQTFAESGSSHLLGSELKEVIVEGAPKPLEVDSTEAQHICQSKDVVQGPLQTQENKVSTYEFPRRIIDVPVKSINFLPHIMSDVKVEETNKMAVGSIGSIEDCLSLFSETVIEWRCDSCKNEQMVGSANEDTTVVADQIEQSDRTCQNEQSGEPSSFSIECKSSSSRQPHASDAQSQIVQTVDKITEGTNSGMSCGEEDSASCSITNKYPECHEGILPAKRQTDLLRTEHISEDVSRQLMMCQDTAKQLELDSSTHQLEDSKNEKKNKVGDAIQRHLLKTLPPVLTLQLKRAGTGQNLQLKNGEHVRFEEYFDVWRYIDPSLEKGNSLYRLVGVVEHIGTGSLDTGHYVAYVRARRLGNQQQQSSCSSSWFCANDRNISQVTLEEVLKREAYILFYERVED